MTVIAYFQSGPPLSEGPAPAAAGAIAAAASAYCAGSFAWSCGGEPPIKAS